MDIFFELSSLIGSTPLIEITYSFNNKIRKMYTKLEWYNLSGSIKDRPAFEILKNSYLKKVLKKGQTICETTSGNMGISICAMANALKNKVVICMPKTMSIERQQLLLNYGAKLELTENFEQAFLTAKEYEKQGAFLTKQFENKYNTKAHEQTAKEIYAKIKNIPCFVSGVGTGGTLMGVGGTLKSKTNCKIIAIEPAESLLLSTGFSQSKHKIQGLCDDIIPKLYNKNIVDKIIPIKSDDAILMSQKLCSCLGLGVGISSGANFLGCVLSNTNYATTIFCDDNKKYLSVTLPKETKSELVENIKLIGYKII